VAQALIFAVRGGTLSESPQGVHGWVLRIALVCVRF